VEHIPTQDGKCVGIKGIVWNTNKVNSKFDTLKKCEFRKCFGIKSCLNQIKIFNMLKYLDDNYNLVSSHCQNRLNG
jgi:hypothetical protein